MSTPPRRGLGRGLGALIPGAAVAPRPTSAAPADPLPAPAGPPEAPGPAVIAIERIRPNPEQPRRVFDPGELGRLAASIRQHGILQPVVVRQADGGDYELVVGERRWRAARQAGLPAIPAVVADVAPRDRLAVALVENVQRHDLNPIELAHAFEALAAQGATQEEIGTRVGFERATIANHLRLLELSRELQQDVEGGTLTLGHAKALLSVASPERRRTLRDRIVAEGLSVRRAEEEARTLGAAVRPARKARRAADVLDADTARVVDALRTRLQTKVQLRGNAARGRLEIEYYGPEELHRLVERILGAS
ncbi:MAG: ParB/RepB/Spo0J family partition protein [Deltaproteobacteria bacterium]|nr:ParB/RepB/Spo0J family partition protein [Deltaproteobacteria bacterium]